MPEKTRPKKGAQKGNRNSLKYGFYSKVFAEAEKIDFLAAADMDGIDEEIALLRLEIKKAVSGGDDRNLLLLVKAAGALEKLVRARYQITSTHRKGLKDAINTVVSDILVPLGVNIGGEVVKKQISS